MVYPLLRPASGRLTFTAAVLFAVDQDPSNNRVSVEVVFGVRHRQVVVNEVMYAPHPGGPEWVEIHNRSEEALDLFGWRIQDGRPSSAAVIQEGWAGLAAGGFAVVCEDTRGSTPGGPNSVLSREASGGVELVVSPNPFRQRAEIAYHLSVSRAVVNLWVFDGAGHRVRTLLNGESGGSRRSIGWDGSGEAGERLKPGIYILYLEAAALDGQVYRTKTPLVLARDL